jgi:ligand-binding sensor domain-containing protein/signal transduction histidine kinase
MFFLALSFMLCQPLAAKPLPSRFDHIGLKQGLSQGTVLCILQDRRGFLWFCTAGGLNRYDGYTFTIFKSEEEDSSSLSSNSVFALYEDPQGALWVGTNGGGVDRLDPKTQKFTHHKHIPGNPGSLVNDAVRDVTMDRQGRLWVATINGLDRLDPGSKVFVHYQNHPSQTNSLSANHVYSLLVDRDGTLWVGTEAGLDTYDPKTNGFMHIKHDPQQADSLSEGGVTDIAEEASGNLWVGSLTGGLNYFDRSTGKFTHYTNQPSQPKSLSSNQIEHLYIDHENTLWVGTEAGLNRFEGKSNNFLVYLHHGNDLHSLAENVVYSVYEDRSGVLWVGTFSQGLSRLGYNAEKFELHQYRPDDPQSLTEGAISSLAEGRNHSLWVGYYGNGFDQYDLRSQHTRHYGYQGLQSNTLNDNSVNAIYEDHNGIVWIGTDTGGLNRFDPTLKRFTYYQHSKSDPNSIANNRIWSIYEDHAQRLWIGTRTGIELLDQTTGKFRHYSHRDGDPESISSSEVFAIYEDKQGYLWLAMSGSGLDRFDPRTGKARHYRHRPGDPNSLSDDNVWSIYEDQQGALWIGTDLGINRLDRYTERFEHFNEKDGLSSNVGCAVLGDHQGNLWIATSHGLSRLNPRTGTFHNFNINDGLQGEEFNAGAHIVGRDGKLYFGGVNGINVVEPEHVQERTYQPAIVITAFRKFNRLVTLVQPIWDTKAIDLSYADSVFSLEFAALDYVAPEHIRYAYRLEGFDKDWIDAGNRREVTYTNLDPGTYRFMVRATNSDGIWNPTPTTLSLSIRPPLWKTPLAYACYGFLALGLVLGFAQYRTHVQARELEKQRQINQLLEQKVEERNQILQIQVSELERLNRLKDDFLDTVSHELRTPLTSIKMSIRLLEGILQKKGLLDAGSGRLFDYFGILKRECNREIDLINDMLDLSRLESNNQQTELVPLDLKALLTGVIEPFSIRILECNQKLHVEIPESLPPFVSDPKSLERILIELLNNACKYTPQGEIITIAVRTEEEGVSFRVSNTGVEIPDHEKEQIFEKFYRIPNNDPWRHGGTGLGLALVKQLIVRLGGTIKVESMNLQTTFTVYFQR